RPGPPPIKRGTGPAPRASDASCGRAGRRGAWSVPLPVQQTPHEAGVHRVVPVRPTGHLLVDDSVAPDQERLGHPRCLVDPLDVTGRVMEAGERKAELVGEGPQIAAGIAVRVALPDARVHAPREGLEVVAPKVAVPSTQGGHL